MIKIHKLKLILAGYSGSGKDTIANILETKYCLTNIRSYTTREKRTNEGNTHIFINPKDVEQYRKQMVGYTTFVHGTKSIEYFCTIDQLKQNAIYILDPIGIKYLQNKLNTVFYKENIKLLIVFLHVEKTLRFLRLNERGDTIIEINNRYRSEKERFQEFLKNEEFDYCIKNTSVDYTARLINQLYEYHLMKENRE